MIRRRSGARAVLTLAAVLVVLVSGLVGTPLASASPERPQAPPPDTRLLVTACASTGETLRYPGRGTCRSGEKTVRFRIAKPVGLCLAADGSVTRMARKACRADGGTFRRAPSNHRLFFCAAKRSGDLRWVRSVVRCTAKERPLTLRNHKPFDLVLDEAEVAENAPAGTLAGLVSAQDLNQGDKVTYALVAGKGDADNAAFEVDGQRLLTRAPLDYEAQQTFRVRLRARDSWGRVVERALTGRVLDQSEQPQVGAPTSLTLTGGTVEENAPSGTPAGMLSASNPGGGTLTYALVNGDGFAVAAGGAVTTTRSLDHEATPTVTLTVAVTNAFGQRTETKVEVKVLDVNEAPTAIFLSPASVAEHRPSGSEVGTLTATDPDAGGQLTYSLVSGNGDTDNASFAIAGDRLLTAAPFDFVTQHEYSVRVQVSDGVNSYARALAVTVDDVNEAPTDLALSNATVAENAAVGTVIGTVSVADPDPGDTHTLALVTTQGQSGFGRFALDGDQLETAAVLDHETTPTLTITVRATDAGGLPFDKVLVITVGDVNEPPGTITLSPASGAENQPNVTVGTLSAPDDGPPPLTYSLVPGPGDDDNAAFTIAPGTAVLKVGATGLDFEAGLTRNVRIQAQDSAGALSATIVTVTVVNVNEPPVVGNDAYSGVLGNTAATLGSTTTAPHTTLTGALPLANDADPEGTPVHVATNTVTNSQGSTLTFTSGTGAFVYQPAPGVSGTDTVTYTVFDADNNSATGTITFTLGARRIWYVDGAATAGGNGTSSRPFNSLAPVNNSGSDADATGDDLYVAPGTYPATSSAALVLETDQTLYGGAAGLSEGDATLIAPGGSTVLSAGGSARALVLGTNATVHGTRLTTTSATAVALLSDFVPGGTVDSASTIDGAGQAVWVTGGSGTLTIAAPITLGAARLSVSSRSAGAVNLTGAITSTAGGSAGISLANNSGASVAFSGGVALDTRTREAFSATGGGTVTVTGDANTLTTTTGTPLTVQNTTIGAAGLTLRSVDANGAANGIVLEATGTAGGLAVTGTGTGLCGGTVGAGGSPTTPADSSQCTGGHLAGVTGQAVRLVATKAPSLTRMWISGSGDDGVFAKDLTGGAAFTSLLVADNGNASDDNGFDLGDSATASGHQGTGAVTLTDTTVARSADNNIYSGLASGTGSLTLTRIQSIDNSTIVGSGEDGVLAESSGTAAFTVSVLDSALTGSNGDQVQVVSHGGDLPRVTIKGNVLTGSATTLGSGALVSAANLPAGRTIGYDISDNTVSGTGESAISVQGLTNSSGAAFAGYIRDNTIGGSAADSCARTGNGIFVANSEGASTLATVVANNTVANCNRRGIYLLSGDAAAALQATVTGNVVLNETAALFGHGFEANLGTTSADTGTFCLGASGNTFVGGTGFWGLRVRHRFATLRLPGYAGTATDTGAVLNHLSVNNPNSQSFEVTTPITGTFTGGAACQQPAF